MARLSSEEAQDDSEGAVDLSDLISGQAPGKCTETAWIDGCGLLDENGGRSAVDLDGWMEDRTERARRRGCHQDRERNRRASPLARREQGP